MRSSPRWHIFATTLGLTLCLGSVPATSAAQSTAESVTLRGVVHDRDGRVLAGANVFVIETLEGVVTGEDGRFEFSVAEAGPVTLVVRRLGYAEARFKVDSAERDSIVVSLAAAPPTLTSVTVQAGKYTASEERGGDGADLSKVALGEGLGLQAVRQRLDARYGVLATLDIVTAPYNGFLVRITLPITARRAAAPHPVSA